jgi:hypothetical protein
MRASPIRFVHVCAWLLVSTSLLAIRFNPTASAEISDEQMRFFESRVRPLLVDKCWRCHGEDEQEGQLRLDSRTSILAGGDSGPATDSAEPSKSLILEAVRYQSLEMPPEGKLSDEEIQIFADWVAMGLPWPGDQGGPAKRADHERFTPEDRAWWAIQPVIKAELPSIDEASVSKTLTAVQLQAWSNNPIDRWIFAKMQPQGLMPAPEADRADLIQRLYWDLIGLPPTYLQVQAFVTDHSADAVERVVDELLASPRYGERWARPWLDLVRYADSDGYRIDHYRPNAWRYRDYVIDSFNHDKPYDRFLQEQLAGDELFPNDPQALIATGFMRHWIYEYNNRDVRGQWSTILNDITDTTSDVFLGLGLQCAKCHDHKFDPLLQRDYFRLQAFFAPLISSETIVSTPAEQANFALQQKLWASKSAELQAKIAEIETDLRQAGTEDAIAKFPDDIKAILMKDWSELTVYEKQLHEIAYRQVVYEHERIDSKVKGDAKETLLALRKELQQFDELKPKPLATAMTARDVGTEAPEVFIPKRAKRSIAPGYPTLIDAEEASILPVPGLETTGRRATLAQWLTEPSNPLTARVVVNRWWQYHFGRGLAVNASDFGKLGGPPTHPELLDWLAASLVENQWSLKWLHRQIVLSATYRQAISHPQFQDFQKLDPLNTFYWRGQTRRLEAEQIRDRLFTVTGEIQHSEVLSIPEAQQSKWFPNRIDGGESVQPDVPRRSIYTRVMRNSRDPLLDAFDLPLFFNSESSRNTTTTPVQSLLLINSSEMLRFAGLMADRLWDKDLDRRSMIIKAYEVAYSRHPTGQEVMAAEKFLAERSQREQTPKLRQQFVSVQPRKTGKIPYRDGQAVYVSPEKDTPPLVASEDLTYPESAWSVETFFQIRSIRDDAAVRTLVSKWTGSSKDAGWTFGVTGKGSRRKPQTLVFVMWGKLRHGKYGEAAVFSDHFVDLNKPYFAAASVKPAKLDEPGKVTFYLKDLSNDDEPLSIVEVEHEIMGGLDNPEPIAIGGCGKRMVATFDGLIDDVRISNQVIPESRLLLTSELVREDTLAYWRFESDPGILKDSSPKQSHLQETLQQSTVNEAKEPSKSKAEFDPAYLAFIDFCHVIMNSNEFLYVD